MLSSYFVSVRLPSCFSTVSLPTSPPPPSPDFNTPYRAACVTNYQAARSAGLSHVEAIRKVLQLLRAASHPWHNFDLVRAEVSKALGLRPGRRPGSGVRS